MSGTLLNPGPYTATSTQYDQGSEQHHAAASSRIRIWVAGPEDAPADGVWRHLVGGRKRW